MDLNTFTEIALDKLIEYLKEDQDERKSNTGDPGRETGRAVCPADRRECPAAEA